MNGTIQEFWEMYKADVLPDDVSETQETETRRAFYAGAASLFAINMDISNMDLSAEAGLAMIEGLCVELESFSEQVENGSA